MKISYSWILEYLDLKLTPQALAERMTMGGLSVESCEPVGGDWVYDIEVTSNRPDWLCVQGIVQEIAALTGAQFKKGSSVGRGTRLPLAGRDVGRNRSKPSGNFVSIDDEKGCGLYWGAVIRHVKVGPSPSWLRGRLETLGLRSVNNVVDITNFCLLETGQPLHAFDLDTLSEGRVVVRRARSGETLALIDGSDRKLEPHLLVIADAKRPVAAAGIMGGRATEVTGATKNVLLESAYFDPVVIRRGVRSLGVASDASYRFERGVDVATVREAFERAIAMIAEIAGGACEARAVAGNRKPAAAKKVRVPLAGARDALNLEISDAEAVDIFRRLGFGVARKGRGIVEVSVPPVRRDISIAEDLYEELVRVTGYDKVPLTAPQIKPFVYEAPALTLIADRARRLLVAAGLKETVTYSLIDADDHRRSGLELPSDALFLENPLSQDAAMLRTSLVPSLLTCIGNNVSRGNVDLELFEIARTYEAPGETQKVGVALAGRRRATWSNEGCAYTLYDMKGLIEMLAAELRVTGCVFEACDAPLFVPGTGTAVSLDKRVVARFGEVAENVKRGRGIKTKGRVFVAEIMLGEWVEAASLKRRFSPVVSLPVVVRDLSVMAGPQASFERIEALIRAKAPEVVRSVSLADTYTGKEIPAGKLAFTVSVTYGRPDRTLTDDEVNRTHQGVLEDLRRDLGLEFR